MPKFESHDFYCINCGHKNIPLCRKIGQQREQFHRKKLYCINCRLECNCIEIKNQEEKEKFLEAYNNGEFKQEAADSISHVRSCRIG